MNAAQTFSRLFRYGITGGSAAVVDLGLFSILCPFFLSVGAAATLSFACAGVVNYALTSKYVFDEKLGTRRFIKFSLFALVGLVFNICVTVLIAATTPLPLPLAKATGIGAAFFFNFWLNAAFVFVGGHRVKVLAGGSD